MLKKILKYIKMYFMLIRYAAQVDLMYWGNFVVSILVELFYQGAFFAFFAVIFTQTKTIAGWGPYEMIVLLGIDTLTSDLLTGLIIAWNSRELPYKIWNGELDRMLLKPIHPLFTLALGRPYFPSFISAFVGFILISIGLNNLHISLSILGIVGSALFFILGFIIVCCIIINFSLLTFFFQDTWTLPRIGERIVYSFTSRPHNIFSGFNKFLFYFILPVVYVSSFSTRTLISGIDYKYLITVFLLTIGMIYFTNWLWTKAVRNYSSASS